MTPIRQINLLMAGVGLRLTGVFVLVLLLWVGFFWATASTGAL